MLSANNMLFHRDSRMPASIVLDDLAKATVPTEYFRSLVGNRKIPKTVVADLPQTSCSPDTELALKRLVSLGDGNASARSLVLTTAREMPMAATEFIICRIGTIGYLTPATIALAQIRNTLRGSPSIIGLAEEAEYLFIDDLLSAHQKRLFDAEPSAAAHFYEFLRVAKYSFHAKVIYCASRCEAKNPTMSDLRDDLHKIYPDSLVDLITAGATIV